MVVDVRLAPSRVNNDASAFLDISKRRSQCGFHTVNPGELIISVGGMVGGTSVEGAGAGIVSSQGSRATALFTGRGAKFPGTLLWRRCSWRRLSVDHLFEKRD